MPGAEHDESDGLDDEKKDEEKREDDDEAVEGSFADVCARCVLIVTKIGRILHISMIYDERLTRILCLYVVRLR